MNLSAAINYKLLPIKAHFFFFFAACAPILPFLPIYAKQLGIDAIGVGVIFAVLPFIGMLAKPVAGWIADRFSKHKSVFIFGILLTGAGYFALQFVPEIVPDLSSHVDCSSPFSILKVCRSRSDWDTLSPHLGSSCPINCHLTCTLTYQPQICQAFQLKNCSEDGTVQFSISSNLSKHDGQFVPDCLYLPIDLAWTSNRSSGVKPICSSKTAIDCQTRCDEEHVQNFIRKDSVFESPMFWMFFLLNILAYSSMCVVTSMGDAIAFTLLEGKHDLYGGQRVWGSIGWGIFTIITGFLVDSQSSGAAKDYTSAFLLLGGLLLLNLIVTSWSLKISYTNEGGMVLSDILRLVSQCQVLIFVAWCVVCGILTSLIWHFLPWYLSDLAAKSHTKNADDDTCIDTWQGPDWLTLLLGLNMGIQCFVGEVPMFFLSGWLIKTLGHSHTMTLVLGAFGARLLLYSVLTNPWYSLLVEVLNGVTFGIFYATMTSYAYILSPPGLESTMQGLVGAAFEGLGVAVGALLGGVIFKIFGGRLMFQGAGGLAIVCCILHAVLQIILNRCCSQDKERHNEASQDKNRQNVDIKVDTNHEVNGKLMSEC